MLQSPRIALAGSSVARCRGVSVGIGAEGGLGDTFNYYLGWWGWLVETGFGDTR